MQRVVMALVWLLCAAGSAHSQDPYQVDLSQIEKEIAATARKPYNLGGFFEFQPTLFGIDRDSAFSRVRFFRSGRGSAYDQYNFRLRFEGSYKRDIFSAFFRADTQVRNDFDGWDEDTRLFEGYVSAKPNENFIFEAGKKVMKWGKGYAWNPVSFIDRPKNPEDPEEALEGSTLFTADYIRSLEGPLKTVTLTTAVIPVYKYVNAKFGELRHVNFASKLYLLAYDTDFDFMVLTGSSRTTRYGFDFSRNLATNLEIHGEFAVINNFQSMFINRSGQMSTRESEALSFLLGLRYLTQQETTYILEYYRNGTGFSRDRIKNFFAVVEDSYDAFVRTGNDSGMARLTQLSKGPYGQPNPGEHYLYFRASQKEPFDILYFTPAITSIVNLTDGSLALIPELVYSPTTNLELRFRTPLQLGRTGTEFGERLNDYRVELRMRYHFQF